MERLSTQSSTQTDSDGGALNSSRSSFTEAVPLSLSSMAHMTIPLRDGVIDGLKEVIQHTWMACVNYARQTKAPFQYSFADIHTSIERNRFRGKFVETNRESLPLSLQKKNFLHHYIQDCCLYLGEPSLEDPGEDWLSREEILGRVRLWFCSSERLTEEELDPEDDDDDSQLFQEDEDDTPPTILYKAEVEYRSLPRTGNKDAVEAEELSMLSFGYSIDDDVKYGALAALYDSNAKYVLEIYSVRGRKYKFDLMSATLSDGRVPRWKQDGGDDPYVKSLCVTVTDHSLSGNVTRLYLSLDGSLRQMDIDGLPPMSFYRKKLAESFLWGPVASAMALPTRHILLLDAKHSGNVYVDGKYMTTWGRDGKIGSHLPALFGMNLHSVPIWHGRIVDYETVKHAYATIWQEVLIDARLGSLDLAGKLLWRLMYGKDDDGYDMDEDEVDTSMECLESQLMSSTNYDPVGICAKALATKFKLEFGKAAFPCTKIDVEVVKTFLGHLTPVVVPSRLIAVLRRGGYFDWKRTMEELWFIEGVRAPEGEHETSLVQEVVSKLEATVGIDVAEAHILWVKIEDDNDPISNGNMCRYYEELKQFHVNDSLLNMEGDKVFWLAYFIIEQFDMKILHEFCISEKMGSEVSG